ncbi:hypothetical protein ACN5L9_004386 [Cronobacter sakazakii]|uniref:hypothetical protein n=1 Tax=Cronobacter TaxID=413496 RepID=UPI0010568F9F|nr:MULTISPECIES: hypothetical protein [Cronobacter]EJJ0549169.1 hypothetical protein [Cronobacter sakazakii]ELY6084753.1 hypothetical protein [Cronobacter sakazakii]MBF4937812.1 hypothetical protein [Cronobacter sakazakii]MBK4114648.1 hypothetical protein [Cronobacter sakazakii]MDI7683507.1 hypothetical protein [Cronobacter sakazakii]
MIENFCVDNTNLCWSVDTKEIILYIEGLDQAMLDDHRQKIIILCNARPLPDKLVALDKCGNKIHSFSPPDGANFCYLTKNSMQEVLVVCVFNEKFEGWHEWHFSIDIKNKTLVKMSPAY